MVQPNFSRTRRQNQTPIYAGVKVIGHVKGDVFYKTIKGSKHILRRPPALAFDVQSLEEAEQAGARKVEVLDTETKNRYVAQLAHVWEKGFRLNRGFGEQIALPMTGFICVRHGSPSQLSLLGG